MDNVDRGTGEIIEAGTFGLSIARPPEKVLEEARHAAKVLKDVLMKKEKPVMMNGEQYLEFEDWQTLAKFYGVTARVKSTSYVQYGEAHGFEAIAEAVDVRTGAIVSSAEAMCLNDEEKWSTRAKYQWKTIGGERVKEKVADEPVPLFQLKSMSQTRACAKSLRNAFAWVVVLAGYKPTIAEEMDEVGTEGRTSEPTENQDVRLIEAKFPSKCAICKKDIAKGDKIFYNAKAKTAIHEACKPEEIPFGKEDNPAEKK